MSANRHPVDELADVRNEMARLRDREERLREIILAGECGLVGDDHEATVSEYEAERVETKALKRELGLEKLRPFMTVSKVRKIKVFERVPLENVG